MAEVLTALCAALERHESAALATVVAAPALGPKPGMKLLVKADGTAVGSLASHAVAPGIMEDCREMIRTGQETRVVRYGNGDSVPAQAVDVYIEVYRHAPTAVIVGAGHVGQHVARVAKAVGFEVVVIDDRAAFANGERFPDAEQVLVGDVREVLAGVRIDGSTYIVLVTRGHKQDEEALRQVIGSSAAYVGMIGSRARVRAVKEKLCVEGYSRERLERLHAPIGLPIGAETPEEIAVSIVAEMIGVRRLGQTG
jgi:xanthine dehydrogenase accessory factor